MSFDCLTQVMSNSFLKKSKLYLCENKMLYTLVSLHVNYNTKNCGAGVLKKFTLKDRDLKFFNCHKSP